MRPPPQNALAPESRGCHALQGLGAAPANPSTVVGVPQAVCVGGAPVPVPPYPPHSTEPFGQGGHRVWTQLLDVKVTAHQWCPRTSKSLCTTSIFSEFPKGLSKQCQDIFFPLFLSSFYYCGLPHLHCSEGKLLVGVTTLQPQALLQGKTHTCHPRAPRCGRDRAAAPHLHTAGELEGQRPEAIAGWGVFSLPGPALVARPPRRVGTTRWRCPRWSRALAELRPRAPVPSTDPGVPAPTPNRLLLGTVAVLRLTGLGSGVLALALNREGWSSWFFSLLSP